MLEMEVVEVRGGCQVERVGGRRVMEGPDIDSGKTGVLCTQRLPVALRFAFALDEGADWLRRVKRA